MDFASVVVGLGVFAALFAAGGLLRRSQRFQMLIVKPLSLYLLYIVIPLSMLRSYAVHGLEALRSYSLLSTVFTLASLIFWAWCSRLVCTDRACRGSLLLATVFPNYVFLPLSLAPILGLDIDVIASYAAPAVMIHYTLGVGIAGGDMRRWAKIPLLASSSAAVGLLVHTLDPRLDALWEAVGVIGKASGFLAAIVVGASLPRGAIATFDSYTLAVLTWRHIASPAAHVILAKLLSVPLTPTVLVEAVMPPATMNTVLARILYLNHEKVASTTLVSTIVAIPESILAVLAT